jgi:hypothetical protein
MSYEKLNNSAKSGTVGTNCTSWDCPIAIDADNRGGFEFAIRLITTGDASGGYNVRINGATSAGAGVYVRMTEIGGGSPPGVGSGVAGTPSVSAELALTADTSFVEITITCEFPQSTYAQRHFDVRFAYTTVYGGNTRVTHGFETMRITTAGNISSIGFSQISTGKISATSPWKLRWLNDPA